ncbi:hypothetical protein JW935_26595 [candidate division KSB1 bacterium]|nr:hypothetical protein [candidate division KSB1 bacterium]
MKTNIFKLLIPLMAVILLVGCTKESTNGPENTAKAPQIPPQSTFIMDFEAFPSQQQVLLKSNGSEKILGHQNWGWAAINVGVWNTFITVGLVVPVAAFVESFNHEPELQADGSWTWSYQVRAAGVLHTAKLRAQVKTEGVLWEMYISKQNAYDEFLWYSGLSNYLRTSGTWTVYKNPDEPVPCLQIEWHRNPAQKTADIRYENITPDDPENGGYIYYGVTNQSPFDAFYTIYAKSKDNLVDIQWDLTDINGRIRDPNHFGDPDWYCWDETLSDVQCNQ